MKQKFKHRLPHRDILSDVTSCTTVSEERNVPSRVALCLLTVASSAYSSTLKTEAARPSET
jgi:hypothetical protein